MDDIVKQALAKWPNVPACWGWLGLDARGNWWLRDAQAQAQGNFPHSKGTRLEHEKLLGFIARNYEATVDGEWFFQNGPQRVYVELERAPMVWRIHEDGSVISHTQVRAKHVQQCVLDDEGYLYLQCDGVLGVVHSQDMVFAAQMIERDAWCVEEVGAAELPQRFGFVLSPQQRSGQ